MICSPSFQLFNQRGVCSRNSAVQVLRTNSSRTMGKSRARVLPPRGAVQLVEWKARETTRGRKGRWCAVKRAEPSKSAQSSPQKSPAKQRSDTLLPHSPDFSFDNAQCFDYGAFGAINMRSGRKKTKVHVIVIHTLLANYPPRAQMITSGNGWIIKMTISVSCWSGRHHRRTNFAVCVGRIQSYIDVMAVSESRSFVQSAAEMNTGDCLSTKSGNGMATSLKTYHWPR